MKSAPVINSTLNWMFLRSRVNATLTACASALSSVVAVEYGALF